MSIQLIQVSSLVLKLEVVAADAILSQSS